MWTARVAHVARTLPDVDEVERWTRLFADLEDELAGLTAGERNAEASARARVDVGRRTLAERIGASRGAVVRVGVRDATLTGEVADAGPDWLLLRRVPPRLVPLVAVSWVDGIVTPAAAPPPHGVAGRFDLRMALRRLARERAGVRMVLCDSHSHEGTIDRVGADHVDLALHPRDEPRRAGAVRRVRCVPIAALAWVELDVSA